ncbi:hypothetical protein FGO68_gene13131 [Halteria grandinella]|uniref:Uncharacterized protein n=1 Tax=Halteria grandinella TaxID=5974 RepID=A0A8J8NB04_HALGN|nr:hypothetical protein FGO68_gene13131 [Halteria grandinella]
MIRSDLEYDPKEVSIHSLQIWEFWLVFCDVLLFTALQFSNIPENKRHKTETNIVFIVGRNPISYHSGPRIWQKLVNQRHKNYFIK